MNPETKPLPPSQAQSVVSVESMPPESALIQFIGRRHICSFPKSYFRQSEFTLTEKCQQQPHRAPQKLRIYSSGVTFTLTGWHLDSLSELLANGKVNSIRAIDGVSAELIVEEPLVCSIHIFWHSSTESITLLPSPAHP
jgi:hypothetical protein